jgi:uncharacterized membrane protein YkvA (DUF1232 family)
LKIKTTSTQDTGEFDAEDPKIYLPATIEKNQAKVKAGFWAKIRRTMGRIPFAEDAVAAYYCAIDPETPMRVKALLLAALAYFILPMDVIPDFFALIGYNDDAVVLATVLSMVARNITPAHRARAKSALEREGEDAAAEAYPDKSKKR